MSAQTKAFHFKKIGLPILNGLELVSLDHVLWCQADSNYTVFNMACGRQIIVTRTLKRYEEELPATVFIRIHQSFLVNVNHIVRYTVGDGGFVTMEDKAELPVSRGRKGALLALIR